MAGVILSLIAEHLIGALLFFSLIWAVLRKSKGVVVNVHPLLVFFGAVMTAVIAGVARFFLIFAFGGQRILHPEGDLLILITLGLPALAALTISIVLRWLAKTDDGNEAC